VLIIAHRGASQAEPENSLAAFRTAVDIGADGVELDVHATADGRIVVHHDPVIDGHHIADTRFDVIRDQQLPNGEPVPTLQEVLELLGPERRAFIEVKTLAPAHDAALLQVITSAPAPDQCHVHSFDHRIVRRLIGACEGLVGGVLSSSYPVNPLLQLEQTGAQELWQSEDLVDDELVAAVHAFESRIIAWTVDDPARLREFADMGLDGICTNTPDTARSVLT
jgi:glycerophosphoryl diester phosphodiesterase